MKKIIFGWFIIKLVVVGIFSCLTFSCQKVVQVQEKTAHTSKAVETKEQKRETSDPYKGDLTIFEDKDRAKNLQIEKVMNLLNISEGKTVADIGAGSGWFSVIAAKKVGQNGRIFAVDINEDSIKYINERKNKEKLENIEAILGTPVDPKLPADSVDAVLILKTYHEISEPVKLLININKSLKNDALIGIIDRSGNGKDHGINKEIIIEEAKKAGLKLKEDYDFVKDGMDYLLIFKKK